MNRLNQELYPYSSNIEFDNGIHNVITDFSKKEDKVVIIDFDSIIHASCHKKKEDVTDENYQPYTIEEIDLHVMPKIKERLFSVEEEISKYFNIKSIYCFIGGGNSYRKKIYPEYKANRKEPLEIVPIVYQKCLEQLNIKRADDGMEADDSLYTLGKSYKDYAILCYIDKDLNQIGMDIPVFNYNKNIWYKVSEKEANYNLAVQVCTGDATDNIRINLGCGEKKAAKFIHEDMTKYQYLKGIILCYRKYNSTVTDVKPLIRLIYKLISLGTKYES